MNSNDIVQSLQVMYGKGKKDIAKIINIIPQRYSDKMKRGTLRVDELIAIMESLGCYFKMYDKETNEEIPVWCVGDGEHVKRMVGKKYYDTLHASAISNTFYEDGINKYVDGCAYELYKDADGQYFIVKYYESSDMRHSIMLVSEEEAEKFVEEHGTKLHREADGIIDF